MFRKYRDGDFDTFLTECGVYELHREVFRSYYENGICEREEGVLLNEVEYEQGRMTEAIAAMLKALAKTHPIVLVINRFRMASRSAIPVALPGNFRISHLPQSEFPHMPAAHESGDVCLYEV